MASDDLSLVKAFGVVVGVSSPWIIYGSYQAYRTGRLARGWRWLRVRALGGVTTLKRKLSYNCTMCQHSMDAMEEVRTLSCNHVFHYRESDKCENVIDEWLRTQPRMSCPVCRKTPRVVLPWKAPPPASPAPTPAPERDEEQTESSSSSSRLEDTASPDLEDPLLPPSQ